MQVVYHASAAAIRSRCLGELRAPSQASAVCDSQGHDGSLHPDGSPVPAHPCAGACDSLCPRARAMVASPPPAQYVTTPAEQREFDIFGHPMRRPSTAQVAPSAGFGGMGGADAAGVPSKSNAARSPDWRFSTAQAEAANERRRVSGHMGRIPPPALPSPAHPADNGSVLGPEPGVAPPPAAAPSSPVRSSHGLAPLTALAATEGPFAGRRVSEGFFRVAYLDRAIVRPEHRPSLEALIPARQAAPLRTGAVSRPRALAPTSAAGRLPTAAASAGRAPAASVAPSGPESAAGMASHPRRGGRTRVPHAPGGGSSMSSIMNWGHAD